MPAPAPPLSRFASSLICWVIGTVSVIGGVPAPANVTDGVPVSRSLPALAKAIGAVPVSTGALGAVAAPASAIGMSPASASDMSGVLAITMNTIIVVDSPVGAPSRRAQYAPRNAAYAMPKRSGRPTRFVQRLRDRREAAVLSR